MADVVPGPRTGLQAKLYYSTTFASPTRTLIKEAIDVSIDSNIGKIDVFSRASQWKASLAGLTELSLTMGYLYQAGTDSVFTALRTAYLAKTKLVFWVMDSDITEIGAQGFAFPALLFNFPLKQDLEAGMNVEFGASLTRLIESAALVDPTWLTISA